MTSPNNMQSLALTNSEKEHFRNSTSNTDDEDDEMPAITNAQYIAELKERHAQQIDDLDERNDQRIVDLNQRNIDLGERHDQRIVDLNQRNIDLKEQIANLQKQHYNHMYFTMLSVFIAIMLTYIFNAKTQFVICIGMRLAYTYNDTALRNLRYQTKVQDTNG
ncbi:hypothetical protein BOTNAR_0309g00100 [Botryotinia narcissicola]|uniref:Uncharacterized protein n=1 Tax=Botryotinia narcissicola TaxID=278944 RepID=A0A4Z1I8J9_9HELO|nr:hypothetical protein BOTNAR_0309g00100 [Botryotinia narcissicola]